ncbi:MAG: flagellar biosynthesis protein FlgJ [Opitutales bacterium]
MSTPALTSVSPASSAISALQDRQLASVSLGSMPRNLGSLPQAAQVKAVAGQFEALLLRQFLQDSLGNIMGGEKSGPSGSIYGYLLTDVLASKISEGGGLGLSSILQHQLTPHAAAVPPSSRKTNP